MFFSAATNTEGISEVILSGYKMLPHFCKHEICEFGCSQTIPIF